MSRKGRRKHKSKRKKSKHKLRRLRGRNRHHLRPKSRGGNRQPSNLLLFDIEKHQCWHKIFKNRTLREVIELLERLDRLKRRQL